MRSKLELTVHQDVNEEDLHCVERIAQAKHCTESDESQSGGGCAQLER